MIRLLLAALGCLAALAAQAEGWGGAYAGASLGGIKATSKWTTTQLSDPAICPSTCFSSQEAGLDASGLYWAGHVGYNWTLGRAALLGLEGSVGNANARATLNHVPGWTDDGMQLDRITTTYEWNVSVVGRAGLTMGPVMIYGLVGPSWQKTSIRFECPSDPVNGNSWCATSHNENRADVRFGWTGGAGVEWQMGRRWTTRLDYRYARYEDKEYSFFGNSVDAVFAKVTLRTSVATLGVSYRF